MTIAKTRPLTDTAADANGGKLRYRILLVTDHYPPFIGGAQRQSRLLAQALIRRGHEVVVATVWQPGMREHEIDHGVEIHRLRQMRTIVSRRPPDGRQHHQPPFPDPVTTVRLRRLIGDFRPDIVHSYGWFSYSTAAALSGKRMPLLLTARDYGYGCAKRTLLRNQQPCSGPGLAKCLGCAADHYGAPKGWVAALGVMVSAPLLRRKVTGLHSISTYVQQMVRRDFLDDTGAGRTGLLPHWIIPSFRVDSSTPDARDRDAAEEALSKLPSEPFILFVGALRGEKGVAQLVEAYQRLSSPPPLVLAGTLERDTPHAFPEGVTVVTDLPHAAVMAAWDRALFGVLPSLWPEPFGSVVSEAMSRGRAVVGASPGGHEDMIVHGETGLLVPSGDVDALAAAMHQLTEDDEFRTRLGRAAAKRAALFSEEAVVAHFERAYAALVAAQTAASR
jgi:glycosyltransferase involved in cell wall biosynthesis